jgi:peptide/nickel transport system permease protein
MGRAGSMSGLGAIVLRRAAVGALMLAGLSFVTFALYYAIPNEPAGFLVDLRKASREEIAEARRQLGVDGSVVEQYAAFLGRLVRGDLGYSWSTTTVDRVTGEASGKPVSTTLLDAARVTASIVLGGIVVLLAVALPLAAAAARRAGSLFDRIVAVGSTVALATHPLVVALLLQLFVASRLGLVPRDGYCSLFADAGASAFDPEAPVPCGGPVDWASHLVLPWAAFALFFAALYVRVMRSRLIDELAEPYVDAARARGASEGRIMRRHALPNAVPSLLAMIGLDIGLAVGITVYVEVVFGLPGVGGLTVRALNVYGFFDLPLIVGVVLLTGAVVIVLNVLVDVAQAIADPRIREGRTGASR